MPRFVNTSVTSITPELLAKEDLISVQRKYASTFRQLAIDHLQYGEGPVAEGFRSGGNMVDPSSNSCEEVSTAEFLRKQAREGEWGTYIELSGLAERLKFTVVVTTINTHTGKKQDFILYRAEDDKAPVIHLENINNKHWQYNGYAKGDGNCMYNAVARALCAYGKSQMSSQERQASLRDDDRFQEDVLSTNSQSTFGKVLSEVETKAVQEQSQVFDKYRDLIENAPKPSVVAERNQQAEKQFNDYLATLTDEKRTEVLQQIQQDRRLALRLAVEEDSSITNSL